MSGTGLTRHVQRRLYREAIWGVGSASLLFYALWAVWVPLLPSNLYTPLLDLGKITGYTWDSTARYALLVAGLYALYAAGYGVVRRSGVGLGGILGFSTAFAFLLLWVYPATAADLFGYVAHGRVLADGLNPFVVTPSEHGDQSLLPYVAFPYEPSQYGPLWASIGGGIALLARGDLLVEVLLYKLLGAIAHLYGALLVFALAKRLSSDGRHALAGAYLYAWNPLLLWEMVGNAHNDGLMALGMLGAMLLLRADRGALALPAVAVAALVKLPSVVIAPVLLLAVAHRSWTAALRGLVLAGLVVAAAYRPFWEGPRTVTALARGELFTASLGSMIKNLPSLAGDTEVAALLGRGITLFLLGLVFLALLPSAVRATSDRQIATLCYASLLAFLLLGMTWFQAWYMVWPFALGAALPSAWRHLEVALLSFGAMAHYVVFIYLWVMGVVPGGVEVVQWLAYLCIVGPLLTAWLWYVARRHVRIGRALESATAV